MRHKRYSLVFSTTIINDEKINKAFDDFVELALQEQAKHLSFNVQYEEIED